MDMIKRLKIFLLFITILSIILFSGCSREFMSVSLEIVGTPNRIVYIANIDTKLDLSGLKMIDISVTGEVTETPLEYWSNPEQEPGRLVYHEIDFTRPGVYEVKIYLEWRYRGGCRGRDMILSYSFFIQVIDEETFWMLQQDE